MIDRIARKQAAEAIRHFLAGRISNDEFVRRYPRSQDPVIGALDDTLWGFYDDLREHTLTGEFAVPAELRRQVVRWVMFLYTDEEYRWPGISAPGMRSYYQPSWVSRITGFSKYVKKRTAAFKAHGDYDVWPFLRREDFDGARQRPALLKGNT